MQNDVLLVINQERFVRLVDEATEFLLSDKRRKLRFFVLLLPAVVSLAFFLTKSGV